MGNTVEAYFRKDPLKDYNCRYGSGPYFRFGANTVTGWRRTQEDKMCCHLDFHNGLSMFAVFDGHGGGKVSEYLKRKFHFHLTHALQENDVETALYLSFLTADLEVLNLSNEEYFELEEATSKKFKPEDASISKNPEYKNAIGEEIANYFREKSHESACNSSSRKTLSPIAKNLIASSETMQKLFLEPVDDDDDDDDDEDYDEEIVTEDSDSGNSYSSIEGEENSEDSEMELADCELEVITNDGDGDGDKHNTGKENSDEKDSSTSKENFDEKGSSTSKENSNEKDSSTSKENIVESEEECGLKKQDDTPSCSYFSDHNRRNFLECGSTATVLVLSKEKAYVANVGDSRCVACVKGNAIDLSKDHVPTDSEELMRIKKSGSKVTNGRINGGLNMSRAIGDLGLKWEDSQEPTDALICHPYVNSIDLNEDLEFIIVASDGIWHSLSSQDVVDFIKDRKNEDPVDTLTELFELLIPAKITDDGSGCDNMSAIIIFFEDTKLSSYIERKEKIKYYGKKCDATPSQSDKEENAANEYSKSSHLQLTKNKDDSKTV